MFSLSYRTRWPKLDNGATNVLSILTSIMESEPLPYATAEDMASLTERDEQAELALCVAKGTPDFI